LDEASLLFSVKPQAFSVTREEKRMVDG